MQPQNQPIMQAPTAVAAVKKCNHLPIIIILAILAVAGLGFGGYEFYLNSQISKDANIQNEITTEDTQKQANNAEKPDDNTQEVQANTNPVLKALETNMSYSIWYESPKYYREDGTFLYMRIGIKEGAVSVCEIYESPSIIGPSGDYKEDCTITGLSDNVYKIVHFGVSMDGSGYNVGFILSDGTVKYLPFDEAMANGTFNVNKTLNIDGFVTDILPITAINESEPIGNSYPTYVFVLSDGRYVEFDESMLQD